MKRTAEEGTGDLESRATAEQAAVPAATPAAESRHRNTLCSCVWCSFSCVEGGCYGQHQDVGGRDVQEEWD